MTRLLLYALAGGVISATVDSVPDLHYQQWEYYAIPLLIGVFTGNLIVPPTD